ncbi:Aldehyde dehydrogenase family protein [Paraburkholderia aspalathi]|uniref:Aldehyde dehydrogenase family protein n=1 Tax=Paraburkholderia aspalathi TaxID=1324617 RepID=A0A1I6YJN6_9BURK|nr:aldehyde dehydrogenase family protein [Paraburkholderia aspalathi]SFT50706.1 Aldehyde dehydrogenase family protein [Paraburkholderia aspalathi]
MGFLLRDDRAVPIQTEVCSEQAVSSTSSNRYNEIAVDRLSHEAAGQAASCCTGSAARARRIFFFEPTVLVDVIPAILIACEETLGSVAPPFHSNKDDEAIEMANDTEYGLPACLHSRDAARIWRNAGGVMGSVFKKERNDGNARGQSDGRRAEPGKQARAVAAVYVFKMLAIRFRALLHTACQRSLQQHKFPADTGSPPRLSGWTAHGPAARSLSSSRDPESMQRGVDSLARCASAGPAVRSIRDAVRLPSGRN